MAQCVLMSRHRSRQTIHDCDRWIDRRIEGWMDRWSDGSVGLTGCDLCDSSGGQVRANAQVTVCLHTQRDNRCECVCVCVFGQSSHTHSHSGIFLSDSKTNGGDRCTHNFYSQHRERERERWTLSSSLLPLSIISLSIHLSIFSSMQEKREEEEEEAVPAVGLFLFIPVTLIPTFARRCFVFFFFMLFFLGFSWLFSAADALLILRKNNW